MSGKTRKSVVKRFKTTKSGKLSHRLPHQNHLNAKQSGNVTRRKRHPVSLDKQISNIIIDFKNRG